MMRLDATGASIPLGAGASAARCASPAGASPAPVGVGAPGRRDGMAGKTGLDYSGGRRPRDPAREPRRRLWVAARRAPGRRFRAPYDPGFKGDVLPDPVLRGRGDCFRAGDAAPRFDQLDGHLWRRLRAPRVMRNASTPPRRRGRPLDARLLPRARPSPPARVRPPSGAALREPGGRAVPLPGRPPASRVQKTRAHGSNGGLALLLPGVCRGEG